MTSKQQPQARCFRMHGRSMNDGVRVMTNTASKRASDGCTFDEANRLSFDDDSIECEYLDSNLLRCLKEKSVADNVQKMTCKPEFVRKAGGGG